jgi:mRNA interferase YafQ
MTKYRIERTSRFKKDYKLAKKRGYDMKLLQEVVSILANGEPLPEKYLDHPLKGDYKDCRECHITPDWLLVYEVLENTLTLYLTRTGTHSDLF